jgi:hypothetical protein
MARKPPHTENHDKAEASADPKAATPMDRFKDLTRGLLNVSPAQLKAEQRRYVASRSERGSSDPSGRSRRNRK